MMRISWETKFLGTFHTIVDESDVLATVGDLAALGFTAEVTMVDNPSESE